MTPTTIVACEDCGTIRSEGFAGWLRCPTCDATYCPICPPSHRDVGLGECDSTKVCSACGGTCLVDF